MWFFLAAYFSLPAGEFSSVDFIRLSGREENLRCGKNRHLVLRSYGVCGLGSCWIIVCLATMLLFRCCVKQQQQQMLFYFFSLVLQWRGYHCFLFFARTTLQQHAVWRPMTLKASELSLEPAVEFCAVPVVGDYSRPIVPIVPLFFTRGWIPRGVFFSSHPFRNISYMS